MALDYTASAALMKDPSFIERVKVACLKYAAYMANEAPNTPGHSSRIKWSAQTMTNPDYAAQTITPPCVMDDAVQNAGSSITDAALQSAVENTVNKLL